MTKGKIVLVPFPFTDLSGQKVRPAVVLSALERSDDFIACFISSKPDRKINKTDIQVEPTPENGLRINSIIKVAKIATLEKKIALGEIGSLDQKTTKVLNSKLKTVFALN
ncbi:type II toxin-antitoxin system PemK/MazF family toxin [Candidatus Nomurabacteria bacterium]|nr:type II toxin-antitoxin system PemK/MazF family toxin [Candidatus Nomurabacteria bacterium]